MSEFIEVPCTIHSIISQLLYHICTCSFLYYIWSSYRDKKRTVSTVVAAASSSSVVVKRRKKRYGSADDVPTVSVSEPNLLTSDSCTKVTKSSSKHKTTKQTNENSNNSNSIGHNLRRDILSVSDTSLNKIPHKQASSHSAKPSTPKSGSREDVKVTSPEQVIYTA